MKKNDNASLKSLSLGNIIFTYATMLFSVLVALVPLVWLLLSSFKENPLLRPGFMLPTSLYINGYITVFRDLGIMQYFSNSVFVAGISVLLSMTMIAMSAYVVARMRFKGRGLITAMLLCTMFIPPTALTFPVYNMVNRLNLYNTHGALILIYACSNVAMSFFVIRNYYVSIPAELEEAARIDGCGYIKTWLRIMLPLAMPGVLTAGVLAFMGNWNEYYWASLVLVDRKLLTVPALLSNFTNSFSTDYNGLFSAIVVIIIPPILLFCCCSRFFVKALSGGAVKG